MRGLSELFLSLLVVVNVGESIGHDEGVEHEPV